jgi:hypothetical protein
MSNRPQAPSPPAFPDYERWAQRWRDTWDAANPLLRARDHWTAPWVDESWHDGNPIFSAWSPKLRRGIRIVQGAEPGFLAYQDTFGAKGSTEEVRELVIACGLDEEAVWCFEDLLGEWLRGSTITLRYEPPELAEAA